MENLGQYLQSLRNEKHLSLDTVHEEIKLTLAQLEAIENNRLTLLGEYGFARAMVYSYIRFLEADERTAMNLFELMWPAQKKPNFTPKKPIKEKKMLISTNFLWLIGIVIFVIILSGIIWVSYSKGYLKRPFDNSKVKQDTTIVKKTSPKELDKPDSLRARMLQMTMKTVKQKAETEKNRKAKPTEKKLISVSDTTDYVNEMIFQTKDSPFNSRF